ncbi:MAG: YdeI/OmpD-associated family protein [Bacteroidota bacterium]
MKHLKPEHFSATIEIIGINPFVFLPEDVLKAVFLQAGKEKGKIPVKMTIDGHEFPQTLVKYSGHWRLYLNTPMRKAAGKDVGDTAVFGIWFDPEERIVPMHPKFSKALDENPDARELFESLPPSRRLEIVRYLSFLKTEESLDRNITKAIGFLLGKDRFIGRDKP